MGIMHKAGQPLTNRNSLVQVLAWFCIDLYISLIFSYLLG
jgi:hypothetical protein